MDSPADSAHRGVPVGGLLGRLLGRPSPPKPGGDDTSQVMRASALQIDGIPFGFTRYRPADTSGQRPEWYEFGTNAGDIDNAPIGVPMGPRHFSALGK